MSSNVLGWVWKHSPATGSARLLHAAMADSARDDGYLSGTSNGYGSTDHMTRKCRFGSKQTTIDARDSLEAAGEILVCRPADRGGRGRHFEYIVVMGRDRAELTAKFGWKLKSAPSDERSSSQTEAPDESTKTASATVPIPESMEPATAREDAHRGAQAAPPASTEQATEPVDNPESAPSDERSSSQTEDGPVSVRHRSGLQRHSRTSRTSQQPLTLANGTQPGDARETVRPVDDVFFADLHAALAGLAPELAWDLTPTRRIQLLEHAGAWSDPAAAIAAFVAAAAAMVDQYGVPRAARAWVPAWLATTPPEVTADEPLCLEHPLGDIPVAKRACAICRTVAVAESAAQ